MSSAGQLPDADLADGRTLFLRHGEASVRCFSPALVALLVAFTIAGFVATVAFLLPDLFLARSSLPLYSAATGVLTVACVIALIEHVRRGARAAQAELKHLTSRTPPAPAKEAARAALLAASVLSLRTTRFDTGLYLRGAGPEAPRLIFLGVEPPRIPQPDAPGEVVPAPILRRGAWTAGAMVAGFYLMHVAIQLPATIRAVAKGEFGLNIWLSWIGLAVMTAAVIGLVIGYFKLKQPRFIVPGALCDDSRGEKVFLTNEESVLTVRRTWFFRAMTRVTIHNLKSPDTSLYFTSEARFVDFVGRWLMPPARVTPASAPTPPPAQAEHAPAGR